MEISGGAVLAVVGASAWASGQRAERPLVDSMVNGEVPP
jgi:hypothetical protein